MTEKRSRWLPRGILVLPPPDSYRNPWGIVHGAMWLVGRSRGLTNGSSDIRAGPLGLCVRLVGGESPGAWLVGDWPAGAYSGRRAGAVLLIRVTPRRNSEEPGGSSRLTGDLQKGLDDEDRDDEGNQQEFNH